MWRDGVLPAPPPHHSTTPTLSSVNLVKNSRHALDISSLSSEGQGIAELKGRMVLIDRVLPGERVDVKLIKVARNYAVGRLLHVVTPSADRISPFCEAFTRCGGCTLQHLAYAAQCRLKTARLREAIFQAGLSDHIRVRDMLAMANPRQYRNKGQYPIARKDSQVRMGFYARHSHDIVEHTMCDVQPAIMTPIRDTVREFLTTRQVDIYDEITHAGLVRHLVIRYGMATGECMVVLVINGEALSHQQEFVVSLTKRIPDIVSIQINHNTDDTNAVLGQTSEVLWGKSTIRDRLEDLWFDISPNSFYQVNPQQTEVLYRIVQEYAGLHGTEMVFDLYCGIGTIAIWLARHAGHVYGIDTVSQAIQDASRNAVRNAVTNVEFLNGAAEELFPAMVGQGMAADVVVLDPPRKGCDQILLETLASCRPERIVYVSCHQKTLLRDLEFLEHHGFYCKEIQPVDLFPHTMHVECVANIVRRNGVLGLNCREA